MATWTNISNTVLEPGDPIRSVDIIAIKENITAMSEGADGAPKVMRKAMDSSVTGQQLFVSSGTYTVPDGVSLIKVTVVGGGGGGGRAIDNESGSSPGSIGGGGGISAGYISVTPGAAYAVVVGSGGAGSNNTSNGSAGGTSSFGSTLLAATGGAGASSAPGSTGAGGVGSGTELNSMTLAMNGGQSITTKRPPESSAAIAYSIGLPITKSAGSGGSGETTESASNASGGVGGAVLVEW